MSSENPTTECSLDAARAIQPSSETLRDQVYRTIASHREGLTDEQIQEITGMNPNTQRPRRLELYKDERITHSGKRLTKSGRNATVWILNQPLFIKESNVTSRTSHDTAAMDHMEVGGREQDPDAVERTPGEVERPLDVRAIR